MDIVVFILLYIENYIIYTLEPFYHLTMMKFKL